MKIAILSRESDSYSTSRLRDAAVARGHEVVVFDTLRFSIVVSTTGSTLLYDARPVDDLDAVIPRIGASVTYVGTAVVRQLEPMGVVSLNGAEAISASRDKLRALQVLARHGLPVPPTVFVRDRKGIAPALERLGGAPVVVKLLEGTQGVGVMLAETVEMAQAIVETLQFAKQNVMVQRFVRESRGRDVRVIVVGGKVVAAMRRMSRGREFRSNLHRGGTAEPVALPPAYAEVAVRAASVLGLAVAGVDMLEGEGGPVVLEVNSSPGLEGSRRRRASTWRGRWSSRSRTPIARRSSTRGTASRSSRATGSWPFPSPRGARSRGIRSPTVRSPNATCGSSASSGEGGRPRTRASTSSSRRETC